MLVRSETRCSDQPEMERPSPVKLEEGVDVFKYLPADMRTELFSYLSPMDTVSCASVSRDWYKFSTEQLLWYKLFINQFPLLRCPNGQWLSDWRQVFGAKFCLEKNWKQDKFEVRSIGPGGSRISHVVNETDTLHSAKTLLLYADKNHKIRISDPYGGQEFKKLTGHRHTVTEIHVEGPLVISGDTSGSIALWDLRLASDPLPWCSHSSELVSHVPKFHKTGISGIIVHNNDLITASLDGFIKVWDLEKFSLRLSWFTNKEEDENRNDDEDDDDVGGGNFRNFPVRCVKYQDNGIVSTVGSYLKKYDLRTGQNVWNIPTEHSISWFELVRDYNVLTSSKHQSSLAMWDIRYPREKASSFDGDYSGVTKFHYDGMKIISCGSSLSVKYFDDDGSVLSNHSLFHTSWDFISDVSLFFFLVKNQGCEHSS
eukprot:TRINITY_DN660_c0_g2_i19.p1 TRINITY_DN660_c0_g2~~TRINITY_DN660_c0_g2_i19.p1  ORF type:complete len:427 (-),score=66.33 TRINITY_DN660_c0_g2_i19:399-1679(-)